MRAPSLRRLRRRPGLREDAAAGLVLGVESVPDGLAQGLLAGVNPVFGLHAYMVGTLTGALATSSAFMAVQATGAMSIVVADVDAVHDAASPEQALFTLSVLTGVVMLVAGVLHLGAVLRFVSNAVMVGFISAVGVNIVLGQLADFTGYDAEGANRVVRAIDTVLHPGRADGATLLVGVVTIALIVSLERTRLGALGLVVAVGVGSALVPILDLDVATLADVAEIPRALPTPAWPRLGLIPSLIVPAASLAFIGLVQGAAISSSFPNPDGSQPDASRDFAGQGAANVVAGVFQGMPVGGSMSASSLVKSAGARSRLALVVAALVMAVCVLAFAPVVVQIAMPSLAGLLIVVGIRSVHPDRIKAVWRTGVTQATVMTVTFVLTMLIPLQYAVLVGVGISMILFVIGRSNLLTLKRWEISEEGMREVDPPETLASGEVVVLQPYGSLFFASAPVFDELLPEVTPSSSHAVVIIRLRGEEAVGSTFTEVLARYASDLEAVGGRLMIVSASDRVQEQLGASGAGAAIGADGIYPSDEWLGATVRRAHADAVEWVAAAGR